MTTGGRLAVVLLGWLALAGVARAQAPQRQIRHALLLGNNVGNRPDQALRYAETEVGRLGEVLRRVGDFDTVEILRGADRAAVEQALHGAADRLAAAHQTGRPTLFLFYYTGHGDNEALELGGTRLPLRDLRGYLELLPADVRVAFVDACQSGALTGVKGGHRAPAYEVRLADTGNVRGLALVTSSTANELSQESDDLRGSYFSHNLMTGLQGLADASGDGQVTLGELYDFSFRRTLASTAANLAGGQHPTYDFRMAGTGDVVLTRTRPSDGHLRFPREAGATYSVFAGAEVAAELATVPSSDLYLGMPAGRYRVLRRVLGGVSETVVDLPAGGSVTLDPREMIAVVPNAGPAQRHKGDAEQIYSVQSLEAHIGIATSTVDGTSAFLPGAGMVYTLRRGRVAGRLRADLASFSANVAGFRSTLLRVAPVLDALYTVAAPGPLALSLGPSLGVPFVRQRGDDGSVHHSVAFHAGAALVGMLPVAGGAQITATLDGGIETYRLDGARTNRPVASLSVGGAFAF